MENELNEVLERIGKLVAERLESGEAGLCYKKELAEKAGVSLTTVFAIIGNKSDYTARSLIKVYLALELENIPIGTGEDFCNCDIDTNKIEMVITKCLSCKKLVDN